MKITLIGSNGLLGSAIKKVLRINKIETLLLTHQNFEITDVNSFKVIKDFNPDIIINTAAYLGVELCERKPKLAFDINTRAVRDLSIFCNNNKYILCQISTDAVFDGKTGKYYEDSCPNPLNMYGLTKYGGELMVKNLCEKYYIFRIPILFGKREKRIIGGCRAKKRSEVLASLSNKDSSHGRPINCIPTGKPCAS
jgi:dTDP-4-dehydrorhamnose reductase